MNSDNQLSVTKQKQAIVLKTVIEQAAAGANWRACCTDLIEQSGMTVAEVHAELVHRQRFAKIAALVLLIGPHLPTLLFALLAGPHFSFAWLTNITGIAIYSIIVLWDLIGVGLCLREGRRFSTTTKWWPYGGLLWFFGLPLTFSFGFGPVLSLIFQPLVSAAVSAIVAWFLPSGPQGWPGFFAKIAILLILLGLALVGLAVRRFSRLGKNTLALAAPENEGSTQNLIDKPLP